MNIFEKVKNEITVRQAAEFYGLQICRGNMTCCLFHPDRHPSMKLNENYYYCFGCGAAGDVIDLTAGIFEIGKYESVKKLAADFGIGPDNPPAAGALAKPKVNRVRAYREDENHCFRVICDYLHLLEKWEKIYAPKTPEETWDEHFVEACQMKDYIRFLLDSLIEGDKAVREETVNRLIADGLITDLESMLEKKKEGGEAA